MGLTPEYKLVANSQDITDRIKDSFLSLRFTDGVGLEGDTLEVVLSDDEAEPIPLPDTGAELELFLGYDGKTDRMGLFIVDDIDLDISPATLTIRGHAAAFEKSKGGKTHLQTQKTRSWPKGTKLGDLVKKIAGEHGLEPAVAKSLAGIALPHLDQSDESDLHFLNRLAKKHDAVLKPAGGKLALTKRGEGKSASGEDLPTVTIRPGENVSGRATISRREKSGTVVAYYQAVKRGKRVEVKVGSGEPVTRLRSQHATKEMALSAARSELDRRHRAEGKVSLSLPGRTDLAADAPLILEGFRTGISGKWIITRVEHELDKDAGYSCTVEGETPNSSGQKNVTETEQ